MSGFALKIIALFTMFIDHTAMLLLDKAVVGYTSYTLMRSIGRISFPLFAYLVAEGCRKSRDLRGYLCRLIKYAAISQIPYSVLLSHGGVGTEMAMIAPWFLAAALVIVPCLMWYESVEKDSSLLWLFLALVFSVLRVKADGVTLLDDELNVFYTYALTVAIVVVYNKIRRDGLNSAVLCQTALTLIVTAALISKVDYGREGVCLILLLCAFGEDKKAAVALLLLWSALQYWIMLSSLRYCLFAAAALPFILLYNRKRGIGVKKLFYVAYPAHITVLALLSVLL